MAKSITLLADPMGVAKSDCTIPRFGHENPWELFKVFAHEAISNSVIFADGSRGGMYKEQWGYSGGFRICIGGKGGVFRAGGMFRRRHEMLSQL